MSQDQDMPGTSEGKSDKLEDNQQESLDNSEQSVRKKIRQNTPNPSIDNTPEAASPPQFVSVEELMETAKGVTNMVLAHEIVVNGGFQIKPSDLPENSLEKRVRDIVRKAFWDCLETQLKEDPPSYDHAIKLVGEIKETLLSFLLPGHTRLRNQIMEALDLELIKQEAENGALDISKLVEFIIGMMGTLCAPARDEEIKKLKDIREIVPLFRAIFSVLDLMKMDMANFAVSSIRPHLMQQSVEYERKKFQELYEKQPNSLDFVTVWLQEAADDLRSKAALAVDDSATSTSGAVVLCPVAIQNCAYLKLLKWNHLQKPFPETVLMDQSRFQEMQLELDQLILIGAILLVTLNAAGPALSGLSDFPDKLKMVIRVLLTGLHLPSFNLYEALAVISEKICAEVNSTLSQHGYTPFTLEKETALKGQVQALANPNNTVCKLIDSRIQSFLESYLASGHQQSFPAVPGGLGPVQKELEEIAVKYVRLVNYNKMVFSPYYDAVLNKILHKEESL
ncbi:T-complex protein 11-like protein 1 isoform X1 [Sceloporus undulatus]|uniref:T-complex protein 11-like protein 1 isoform X1 n=2 Tax=Sceloporus undulatus TaxID=8520 RepID=UPI001C4B70B7|nr:T-complex protein 11-like protein 1 isoform X1 [Sceloporus undulatus]XP_042298739.1 T-complex protein 11-like protein 1 isoform X1 [Sceloporus undulatus]XP_042298750.1 T-complex protein 11-like protein 1 isoform X1 [Sceloporus undulatus]XP_042298758.1 T-complex protein 11-like protein 1 isoform X1 [Sceloporus undulatus]XP_042298768.1 T-complex protein 11-like protein 1 isoform X1 [Sceloporus undulatus]XP_042298775.1 T-complex protein 11-like protein 1 isoform X1 [Sceloporus undulatus]